MAYTSISNAGWATVLRARQKRDVSEDEQRANVMQISLNDTEKTFVEPIVAADSHEARHGGRTAVAAQQTLMLEADLPTQLPAAETTSGAQGDHRMRCNVHAKLWAEP